MITGRDLETWLVDTERQRRSALASDVWATSWRSGADHLRFEAAMAGATAPTAEAVAEAVTTLFRDEHWLSPLIDSLASATLDDPFFAPPFRTVNSELHTGLLLFDDHNVSIAAGVSRVGDLAARKSGTRGKTSVSFTGQVTVLKFMKAGGATLSFWEAPPINSDFSAANAGRCRRTGERRIGDGEIIVVDGRRQSYVIEHAAANLVVLQGAVKRDQAPLLVEYDSLTGDYVGCSAADDGASRVQMIATLLRKLGAREAVPVLVELLDDRHFFVRWHVMRELLGLDAAAALPHLKRMAARDPHADVRRTARALLDRIESGALDRKAA